MNMNTITRGVWALAIALLTGCVTVYEEPQPARTEQSYSAVTSHSDQFNPSRGETFAWFTNGVVVSDENSAAPPAHIRQTIEEIIENQLIEQGFRVAQSPNTADFLIGAGILNKDAEQSQMMLDFIEVFPAIRETLDADQPVTLLVTAGRPANIKQHHLMWRGAVNAAVVAEDMPEQEQRTRLREIVDSLFARFP